jgi:membrane protein implicated in regulation of membrane protease activity
MEWFREHAWETWLALAMVLGVAEMFSLDLVLLMLAAGAGVGIVAALAGAPVVAQVLLAIGGSAAMLLLARPALVKRLHGGPDLVLGSRKLIGVQALTTEPISTHQPGSLKIDGETWTAKPYDETLRIEPGSTVEVLEIRGATAYVHPVSTLET